MAEADGEPVVEQRTLNNEGSINNIQGLFKFSSGEPPKGLMKFSNDSPRGTIKFASDSPTIRAPLTPTAPMMEDDTMPNENSGGQADMGPSTNQPDDGVQHKHHEHFHGYHSERQYRESRSHQAHHHHHDHGHHHEGHHHAHGSRRH